MLAVATLIVAMPIANGRSQEPPQTPKIQNEQKPDSTLENQQQPGAQTQSAPNSSATSPQIIASTSNYERQGNTHKSEEEGTEFWPALYGYRIKITDSLLAIFTFGLFIATWLLARDTKHLVIGAEQWAERELRAYVLLGANIIPTIIERNVLVHYRLENYGKTPAFIVSSWSAMAILGSGELGELEIDRRVKIGDGATIIPPGSFVGQTSTFTKEINIDEWNNFTAGISTLYIWGTVRYKDVFGKEERATKYRLEMTPDGSGRMIYSKDGNKAT